MLNKPLIRPYFLGGVALVGVARIPMISSFPQICKYQVIQVSSSGPFKVFSKNLKQMCKFVKSFVAWGSQRQSPELEAPNSHPVTHTRHDWRRATGRLGKDRFVDYIQ